MPNEFVLFDACGLSVLETQSSKKVYVRRRTSNGCLRVASAAGSRRYRRRPSSTCFERTTSLIRHILTYCSLQKLALLLSLLLIVSSEASSVVNNRPVVGIVAEDYYGTVSGKTTYIAASYVKWVEAAGARVLPIFINQTDEYYDRVLGIVSGVVFPGWFVVRSSIYLFNFLPDILCGRLTN